MANLNLGNVEPWSADGGLGPTPDGCYHVAIKAVEERSSQAGNDVWNLELTIEQGEYAGRTLYDNITWTEKAAGRIVQFFQAVGIPVKSGDADYKSSICVGKKGYVVVRREAKMNGEGDAPRVKAWSKAPIEVTPAPQAGDDFTAQAAAKLGATPVQPVADDDIPF